MLAKSKTPVYLAIGDNDSYYGSQPLTEAYNALYRIYKEEGLSQKQIDRILVLDVKSQQYFTERGFTDQHMGGSAFAHDKAILG